MPEAVNYDRIAGIAAQLRDYCRLTEPPFSTQSIIEVYCPDILVAPEWLPAGFMELARREGAHRSILYRPGIHTDTHRVAIAHGLYHHLADLAEVEHGQRTCAMRSGAAARAPVSFDRIEDVELAADLFAGELLTPLMRLSEDCPRVIRPRSDVERAAWLKIRHQLSRQYGVPVPFMNWRLRHLAQFQTARVLERVRSIREAMIKEAATPLVLAVGAAPRRF